MITPLSRIFGSKAKAQEVLLVQHNIKPVLRQGFYSQELPAVEKYCHQNNLFLEKSKFKVVLADKTCYSNKGLRVPEEDPRLGMLFVYISQDEEKALLAAYYELVENHKALGLLLGYPECCVTFFCANFSAKNPNPQHPPTNAWTNLTQRPKDCVILSHFPCSSDCEASITLAKKYTDALLPLDPAHTHQTLQTLKLKK